MAIEGAAGHSLGEFAALVAAGVLTLEDAVGIVVERGRAMQAAGDGAPRNDDRAPRRRDRPTPRSLCDEAREADVLLVANENAPQQVVISGSVPAIERAEALAAARRIRAVRLKVAGAFHSPLMDPAVGTLGAALDAVSFSPPRFPVASNVTGELVRDPEQLRALAKRQVVSAGPLGAMRPSARRRTAATRSSSPAPATCSRSSPNVSCPGLGPSPSGRRRPSRRSSPVRA